MTATTALMVGLGAAVGAPARYLLDRLGRRVLPGALPWGTLAANVGGSLVLGGLTAASAELPPAVQALAATGFCGALTTYSTFSYEVVALTGRRARRTAVGYLLLGVLVGVLAAVAGRLLVEAALR